MEQLIAGTTKDGAYARFTSRAIRGGRIAPRKNQLLSMFTLRGSTVLGENGFVRAEKRASTLFPSDSFPKSLRQTTIKHGNEWKTCSSPSSVRTRKASTRTTLFPASLFRGDAGEPRPDRASGV